MEFRAPEYHHGPYVDRHIRKVAETPLEGSDAVDPEQQVFGPFLDDSISKAPNKKGFTVRFEGEKATGTAKKDPIEHAFDSFFMFYDEMREQANSPRADGSTSEWVGRVADNMECVTDRVCRNPCVENCVDLMEHNQEADERELLEWDDHNRVADSEAFPMSSHETMVKENSVKDFGAALAEETPHEAPGPEPTLSYSFVDRETPVPTFFVPTYSPVDAITEKLRTIVPEPYLQQFSDAFIIKTGEVKPGAGALVIKYGADSDLIVEAIDKLILFFDDVHLALSEHKIEVLAANLAADLVEILTKHAKDIEEQASLLMSKQPEEIVADLKEILVKQADIVMKHAADIEKQAAEILSNRSGSEKREAQEEIVTTPKIKPESLKMRPAEYIQALESAASVLSEYATPEEIARFSKEELHRRALEKIMSERPELEEGFTEYKTESQLLQELMPELEPPVPSVPSEKDSQSGGQPEGTKKTQTEGLIVLGHSATLTPIPEADEGSAATPHSDMIEHGVMHGTIPQVPIAPGELGRYALADAALANDAFDHEVEPKSGRDMPTALEMEFDDDPIVNAFDRMFMCFDDIEEERNKACNTCIGSSVPSDLIDPADDINEHSASQVEALELRKAKEEHARKVEEEEAAKARAMELQLEADRRAEEELNKLISFTIEPRPDPFLKPEERGEQLIQEALQVLREASKLASASSADDTNRYYNVEAKPAPAFKPEEDPADDLVGRLTAAFDEAKDKSDIVHEDDSPLSFMRQLIANVNSSSTSQAEKDRGIALLVDAALSFQENDKLLKSWRLAVDHPGLKGVEDGMSPQMSSEDPDKQHAKVEFEIPEMMKQPQEPCMDWAGDDSELMASINADRKLSEMERENIFRDVSQGLQGASGGVVTRVDHVLELCKAPAFTEGNSSSAEQIEDRLESAAAEADHTVLGGESVVSGRDVQQEQPATQVVTSTNRAASKLRETASSE